MAPKCNPLEAAARQTWHNCSPDVFRIATGGGALGTDCCGMEGVDNVLDESNDNSE